MTVSSLPARRVDRSAESLAERMRRLRAEAEASARDHAQAFLEGVSNLETMALDIAGGGEAYVPGIRELARRLSMELESARLNADALLGR